MGEVMKYFIGDLHLFDEGIIKICNRPFSNAEEMANTLIKNWNGLIKSEDEVYVVGDVASEGTNWDNVRGIITQLNGTKYLIKGNHDTLKNSTYRKIGFDEAYDKPIIIDGFWIVSHEPMFVTDMSPYANIYAHVHNNPNYTDYSSRGFCVSAERTNYTPVSMDYIKECTRRKNLG